MNGLDSLDDWYDAIGVYGRQRSSTAYERWKEKRRKVQAANDLKANGTSPYLIVEPEPPKKVYQVKPKHWSARDLDFDEPVDKNNRGG